MRGDRAYPVSASDGNRSVWKIYVDDFMEMATFPTDQAAARDNLVGTHQGTLRVSYEERTMPRNTGKAHTSDLVMAHVGD